MEVQSVIFPKDKFSLESAIDWLISHNYKVPKVDETEEHYRFRQHSPKKYIPDRFRTVELINGAKLIINLPRN